MLDPSAADPTAFSRFQAFARRRRDVFGIALLALTLNLVGNDRTSLWDRDEPRYAGCTREMRARGDWLFPTFNGAPRFQKPILIYWVMRFGFLVAGDNPFGARLGSTIAGTASCLLVLSLGKRMLGARAGQLSALMYTTAPIVVAEAKLATTDATLGLFLVAAQFCLWELSRRASRWLAATFWLLLALATLTKGPVGPALIAAAGAVSWLCGGSTAPWRRLHWRWGPALSVFVAAPWFLVVGWLSRGEFFQYALGKEVAERVVTSMEQHGGFPGFYVITGALTFHPWAALLPAAYLGAWRRRHLDPLFGFLLGWVFGPMILLECVQTKMVHYYLPALPACSMLVAWLVEATLRGEIDLRRDRLARWCVGLLGAIGIGLGVGFVALAVVLPRAIGVPCLIASSFMAVGTSWSLVQLRRGATLRAMRGLAATSALLMLLIGGWLLPAVEPFRMPRIVAEKIVRHASERDMPPVLLGLQEPSMVYAIGRPAPAIQKWDTLYDAVDRHGAVVTAIIHPLETVEFAKHPDLQIELLEVFEGYNFNNGSSQLLHLAVIRRKGERMRDDQISRAGMAKVPAAR